MTWDQLGMRLCCRLPLAATDLPRPLVDRALAAGIRTLGDLYCDSRPREGREATFAVGEAERAALELATEPGPVGRAYGRLIAALAEVN